jgi:quinol monooxygenase YgiN
MSLLVHYTLNDAVDHKSQTKAMSDLVKGLKSENIDGLDYSCFSTTDPTKFIGLLEFPDEETKQGFLSSASFATYREKVGPTFANPPQTTEITAIASTR